MLRVPVLEFNVYFVSHIEKADRSLVPALGWSVVPALGGSLVPAYVPQITAGPHVGPPPAKTQTCHLCPPVGLPCRRIGQQQSFLCPSKPEP